MPKLMKFPTHCQASFTAQSNPSQPPPRITFTQPAKHMCTIYIESLFPPNSWFALESQHRHGSFTTPVGIFVALAIRVLRLAGRQCHNHQLSTRAQHPWHSWPPPVVHCDLVLVRVDGSAPKHRATRILPIETGLHVSARWQNHMGIYSLGRS